MWEESYGVCRREVVAADAAHGTRPAVAGGSAPRTLEVALVRALGDLGAVVARPARVADADAVVAVALLVTVRRARELGGRER